jgi:hypothetical protein
MIGLRRRNDIPVRRSGGTLKSAVGMERWPTSSIGSGAARMRFRLLEAGQKSEGRTRMRSSLMAKPNLPAERLDAMAHEIVQSYWLFKNAQFLRGEWSLRMIAAATSLIWLTLGWLVWFSFGWLGWMSLVLVVGWFAYEALFRFCCWLVRLRIQRGRL